MANQTEECDKWTQLDPTRIKHEIEKLDLFERRSKVIDALVELIVREKEHSFGCGFVKAREVAARDRVVFDLGAEEEPVL